MKELQDRLDTLNNYFCKQKMANTGQSYFYLESTVIALLDVVIQQGEDIKILNGLIEQMKA